MSYINKILPIADYIRSLSSFADTNKSFKSGVSNFSGKLYLIAILDAVSFAKEE